MVQAFIHSRLDYGNALYLGTPQAATAMLHIVQNCAAHLLLQTPYRQSAKPALRALHWLPVLERISFKALCITHKSFWGKGPTIIQTIVSPYCPNRNLRSTNLLLASVPKIKKARSGGRSFSYNAAKLWNTLPFHLRREIS